MFDNKLFQLPGFRGTLIVLILFSILEATCILGQATGLSRALVSLWEGTAFDLVIAPLSLFASSFVGVRIVLNVREIFIEKYAQRCTEQLRENLLASIFRTGAPAVQEFGTGATSAMALDGIDKVKSYLKIVMPKLANMMVLPLAFAIAITMADWVSGIVVIILLPSMMLLMILIGKTTADRGHEQHATFKAMSNHFIDSVRGISTLSTFEVSKTYAGRVHRVSERFREATLRTLRTATLSGSVLDLFATLAIAAVSIMLALRLIDGSLALLPALFVLILVPEYFRPIREYASDYHASLDGVNSLRTIEDMIEATSAIPVAVPLEPWTAASCLTLDGVSRTYDSLPALEDASTCFAGTQRVGIVGLSGSGKSTLLRLLAGLEDPSSGDFVLTSSKEDASVPASSLETLRQLSWQDQIAYIPQDPYIFHATLRENLTFYEPRASQDRIDAVVSSLGLDGLVDALPQGLDTIIGEAGRELSGGQAQRIALARVLLDEKRKILLFDEPTAHLDIETEYELKAPMIEAMEDKLVVFATHRLHWLDSFDRVIVLDKGCIVEEGPVSQLAEQDGSFKRLVNAFRGGDAA